MILVDASVLISFLRSKDAKIDGLLRSHPVATQEQLHQRLLEKTPAISPDLTAAWQAAAQAAVGRAAPAPKSSAKMIEAQFHVLVTCRDARQQVELLRRFGKEGLTCKALLA